ncbi:MFS transporter [Methylopila turkensis]|uniref:MFS transporter n=1 Tax=Methylopila turkensis TaxID=1437816 RepID=A0A9W6N8U9_9HYPH|nr:MFS transporter [Methylopila turkensis]GLK81928.1 MFS transporter [Methylopila turkensis]
MPSPAHSTRVIAFVNVAHALDHYVLLIYPTAVIAMAGDLRLDYGPLIALATGAFVAFGLFALPMGWLAVRFGRRNLLAVFFFGCSASLAGLSFSATPTAIAVWLFVLGAFTAIYHPIGASILVSHASSLGRALGWNGVFGNVGTAFAAGGTALLASAFGWRAAFLVPAAVCLAVGLAYVALAPADDQRDERRAPAPASGGFRLSLPVLLTLFGAALVAGGMTFNITSIALPKAVDERLGVAVPLVVTGWLVTGVFLFGALTQLVVGRLVDRFPLPTIFVGLSALQPLGLGIAAATEGAPMLAGLALTIAAIYGQVVVNDAMVARYTPPHLRTKAYSVRYFLGFTVSGFAATLIGATHSSGGFGMTFAIAAAFGAVIFGVAIAFFLAARPAAPAPAE